MGFRVSNFCTVWKAEDKGNYSVAQVSTSKKNKDGNWEIDFQDGFVRLVGQAHEFVKKHGTGEKGLFAKIMDCEVTKRANVNDLKKVFTNFTIFKLEEFSYGSNDSGNKSASAKKTPAKAKPETSDDDEPILPF